MLPGRGTDLDRLLCREHDAPARLWVSSTSTSVGGGYARCPRGFKASKKSAAVKTPSERTSLNCTSALAAAAPVSCHIARLSRERSV